MINSFKDNRWNRYDEKRKYRRLIVWTEDNAAHLPPDYIPALKAKYGANANMVKAHLYGEFCPLYEGNAYPTYIPSRHDIADLDADPYNEINLNLDFNSNPVAWTAVQRARFHFDGHTHSANVVLHEAENNSSQLDDAIIEFMAKFPAAQFARTPINIYGDRSGHADSHKMRGSDYDMVANLLKWGGYHNVRVEATRLVAPETASVDALCMMFLQDLLFLCTRAKLTKRSLMATTWKAGKRKLDKPTGETWTHHSDGLKYWAWQTRKDTGLSDQHGRKTMGVNW